MIFRKKYDSETVTQIMEYYLNFKNFLEEFSSDIGVSSSILGKKIESKEVEYNLRLIESYMFAITLGVISVQKNSKSDYVKYVYEMCNDRQDRANKSIMKISNFDELVQSQILKEKVSDMFKCNVGFLSCVNIFFKNYKL